MAEYLLNSLNLYRGSKTSQDLNKIGQVDSPESRFPGIAGNTGNHGKDEKFHKRDQIFNQT